MTLRVLETAISATGTTAQVGLTATFNIASRLPQMAADRPLQPAVRIARSGESLTFAELESLSNRYAQGLSAAGIAQGERVLVMVKPGFEFLGLIFALFKIGAVPVMIDPGMGIRRMMDCIGMVDLRGFIGAPFAQAVRVVRPRAFRTARSVVTVGRRWFWGGPTLNQLKRHAKDHATIADTKSTDAAAILFTSGSTGPAKGVVYQHRMFDAQVRMIQSIYGIEPGEIDLPTFPPFALFSVAMGMTAVIPDMDAARPARVDPAKFVEAVCKHGATNTFGSPAVWNRVAPYCMERRIRLPTLRRVLIAGAPVPWRLIEQLHGVLSNEADVYTPYGATEALPISSLSGREAISLRNEADLAGAGTCVGRTVHGIDLRLIRITDDSIQDWSDDLVVEDGQFGEIAVAGPVVTEAYSGLSHADALSKIRDRDRVWHRMGDIGFRDPEGRLWFCGRKSQRVITKQGTLFTDCCESVFNEHPDVARSALVGIGPVRGQKPVMVVEPRPGRFPHGPRVRSFISELLALSHAAPANRQPKIENRQAISEVLFHRSLPVDSRHNAKINREALALWAARRLA